MKADCVSCGYIYTCVCVCVCVCTWFFVAGDGLPRPIHDDVSRAFRVIHFFDDLMKKTRRVTCDQLLAPAQLSDVKNVQVYGIVVSCQTPKKSSGTDHYMTMSVVDSHVTTGEAIDVRIFGPPERLPFVLQIGDIVRLDRYVIIPIYHALHNKHNLQISSNTCVCT